jgi:hypothetical protein
LKRNNKIRIKEFIRYSYGRKWINHWYVEEENERYSSNGISW